MEADRISVLPYGVDSDLFKFGRPRKDAPFTALFIGQKVARKGLRSMVRAWKELGFKSARLVVAGGHVRDHDLLSGFEGVCVEVPRTGLSEVIELYQNADVFVLPSIAEGFGHVYLEPFPAEHRSFARTILAEQIWFGMVKTVGSSPLEIMSRYGTGLDGALHTIQHFAKCANVLE